MHKCKEIAVADELKFSVYQFTFTFDTNCARHTNPHFSIWPHLFHGAGHEKRRGVQLKWSLAFTLYTGSFPCAKLPGPVRTARLGRACFFCVFSLGLCFVCSFVPFDLFVSPFFCVSLGSYSSWR